MKILVYYSSIVVTDYEQGDCEALEKNFTLYDKIRHQYYISGIEFDEENKLLYLPRGVDIYYIEQLLGCKAQIMTQSDPYDFNVLKGTKIKFLPRDDEQREAIRFMTGSDEYYKYKTATAQLVSLNTGKGKTYCTIVASVMKGYRTMVIASSIDLLRQWKKCILEYCSNINKKEIYTISGIHTIYKIIQKPEIVNRFKFILVSDSTIRSYGDKYGWDKVSELFKILRIGVKVYDECHLHFDMMCKIDFHTNTNLTYYLSATPLRSQTDENFIYQLYFKNIPSLELFDEDNDPHTNYIAMKFNSKPTILQRNDCASRNYGLDRNKYVRYIVNNENFYKLLKRILRLIRGKKSLIFIGVNDAIETVKDWIVENYPELEDEIGIYNSLVDKESKSEQLEKNIILSTTKSSGQAMDIKGLKFVVVLAEPFKSEILTRQTLGRTRDKGTYYIDIVDTAFPQITRYYKYKLPIFKKYALSMREVIVKQSDLDDA